MTWDLAESGKHFVNCIINGSDIVPTFSATSVDDLRSEVTSSSWLNDLRDQGWDTRVISVVYRSAMAIGSRLPSSMASAKARVAGAGALLQPVSSHTGCDEPSSNHGSSCCQDSRLFQHGHAWAHVRRKVGVASISNSEVEDSLEDAAIKDSITEPLITDKESRDGALREEERHPSVCTGNDSSDEEKVLHIQRREMEPNIVAREEEVPVATKEITCEEILRMTSETGIRSSASSSSLESSNSDNCQFYPPGKTMHIVAMLQADAEGQVEERVQNPEY